MDAIFWEFSSLGLPPSPIAPNTNSQIYFGLSRWPVQQAACAYIYYGSFQWTCFSYFSLSSSLNSKIFKTRFSHNTSITPVCKRCSVIWISEWIWKIMDTTGVGYKSVLDVRPHVISQQPYEVDSILVPGKGNRGPDRWSYLFKSSLSVASRARADPSEPWAPKLVLVFCTGLSSPLSSFHMVLHKQR